MCAKGVKSENVSVHAKLYSFGKFDIKLLSRNFINSFITIFVSPGAIMQSSFLCRRKKVEKMYACVRDKCLHLLSREISTLDQRKLSSAIMQSLQSSFTQLYLSLNHFF